MKRGPKPQPLLERFLRYVYPPNHPDDCIPWRGPIGRDGYGRLANTTAHRLAYRLFVGDPGDGRTVTVDHLCRNRPCVNVMHLEVVPQIENVRRGLLGGATHCKRGHEFTPENTIVGEGKRTTRRRCRECKNARQRYGRRR